MRQKLFKLDFLATLVILFMILEGCNITESKRTEISSLSKEMGFVIQLPGHNKSQRAAYYTENDATSYEVELKKSGIVIDTKTGAPGDLIRFTITEEGLYTIKVTAYKNSTIIAEGQKDSNICFGDGDVTVKISLEPKTIETNVDLALYWNTPFVGVNVGDKINLGRWPQSVKEDSVTITDETKIVGSNTYYKGTDDEWYAKHTENAQSSDFIYSNGTSIPQGGTSYNYFKVEPIEWLVLSDNYSGKKLLVSEKILSTGRFDYDSNNYKESDIRHWLNDDFYNSAFTANEQARISLTEVDNSANSTEHYSWSSTGVNNYACENTYDNIFLLSRYEISRYKDVYSFFDGVRVTSDYARASGAGGNGDYGQVAGYLTRSSSDSYSTSIYTVNYGIPDYGQSANDSSMGIVPALCLE